MKRVISSTCLAAAFAVGLSAQTPTPSAPATQSEKDSKAVTVTGCLRAGDAPGSFVLNNVKAPGMASNDRPASATGTAGTAPGAPPAMSHDMDAPKSYALAGSPTGVTLSDHVGHTVAITGTTAPASSTAGTAGSTSPSAPAPGAAASTAPKGAQPTLNVTSFKMVSGSCSM